MVVSTEQIDSIVAAVVQKLRDSGVTNGQIPAATAAAAIEPRVPADPTATEPVLCGRLVTLETLRDVGYRNCTVRVESKAVITPAAQDELRQRGLTIVRACGPHGSAQSPVVFFVGNAVQRQAVESLNMPSVSVEIMPSQTAIASKVAAALRTVGARAVCITDQPFATAQELMQNSSVRPATVRDAVEAAEAIQQADTNAFIIRQELWSSTSPTQIVRALRANPSKPGSQSS